LNNQTGAAPTALASFLLLTEDISDNVGGGKRLFADGTVPAAFKVTESAVTSRGVITSELRAGRRSPNRKCVNIRPGGLGF